MKKRYVFENTYRSGTRENVVTVAFEIDTGDTPDHLVESLLQILSESILRSNIDVHGALFKNEPWRRLEPKACAHCEGTGYIDVSDPDGVEYVDVCFCCKGTGNA